MKERDKDMNTIRRCSWCNPDNPVYIRYHDEEWGVPCHDDHMLYELLILESFQAGLSWEIILNKREAFRIAYDGFYPRRVSTYDEKKIEEMMQDRSIVRNERKIRASIANSRVFLDIQKEYGSFAGYLWRFTDGKTIFENDPAITASSLSDRISADLKRRGMSFVGSTIIYSYLQAAGIINAHEDGCFKSVKPTP